MKTDNAPVIDSLTGSFLISTQKMPDPRFEEQVIFICAHSNDGAMGVAINRPNSMFIMSEVLQGAGLPLPDNQLPPVYIGGPVELESAFILYKSDYFQDAGMFYPDHCACSITIINVAFQSSVTCHW